MKVGDTIIDTALPRRPPGRIASFDLDTLEVSVMWKRGQVTTLRLADIQAGRYQVVVQP